MDEEVEQMVISVRADTAAFARDVATMRSELEGPLVSGAGRAGRLINSALTRAITSGKLGFGELKKVALAAMGDIASASLRALFAPSRGGGVGRGLINGLGSLIAGLVGSPGRATGGPVSGGRSYMVGERGPELFVPSSNGRIEFCPAGGRAMFALQFRSSPHRPASRRRSDNLRNRSPAPSATRFGRTSE